MTLAWRSPSPLGMPGRSGRKTLISGSSLTPYLLPHTAPAGCGAFYTAVVLSCIVDPPRNQVRDRDVGPKGRRDARADGAVDRHEQRCRPQTAALRAAWTRQGATTNVSVSVCSGSAASFERTRRTTSRMPTIGRLKVTR